MDCKLFAYKRNGDTSNECRVCSTQDEADSLQTQGWHISPVEIAWTGENAKMFGADGNVIDRPKPEPPKQYVPTLEELKNQKRNQMKMQRDTLESSGFTYLNKTFDSDFKAVQRMSVAVLAVQASGVASFEWTLADNTAITMTAQEFLGLPVALAVNANLIHERYRQLKLLIDSCTTVEQVETITWDTIKVS